MNYVVENLIPNCCLKHKITPENLQNGFFSYPSFLISKVHKKNKQNKLKFTFNFVDISLITVKPFINIF